MLTRPCDPGREVCHALPTDSAGGNAVPCRFSTEGPPRGHFFSCSDTRRRLPTADREGAPSHVNPTQKKPAQFFFKALKFQKLPLEVSFLTDGGNPAAPTTRTGFTVPEDVGLVAAKS